MSHTGREETVYTWEDGLLESMEDALGQRTTYLYNGQRRLETILDAEEHRTTFVYSPSTGTVTAEDALGRLTTTG